jgi:hypothetical protein
MVQKSEKNSSIKENKKRKGEEEQQQQKKKKQDASTFNTRGKKVKPSKKKCALIRFFPPLGFILPECFFFLFLFCSLSSPKVTPEDLLFFLCTYVCIDLLEKKNTKKC